MRRADQRADIARVLHAVDHQDRAATGEIDLPRRPRARLHDRQNTLRRVGGRELGEGSPADVLHRHRVPLQLRPQLAPSSGALQLGRHQHPSELQAGGQCFFHETDSFEQCQAAPTARLAPLEITHRSLQIIGYATSHTPDVGSRTSPMHRP